VINNNLTKTQISSLPSHTTSKIPITPIERFNQTILNKTNKQTNNKAIESITPLCQKDTSLKFGRRQVELQGELQGKVRGEDEDELLREGEGEGREIRRKARGKRKKKKKQRKLWAVIAFLKSFCSSSKVLPARYSETFFESSMSLVLMFLIWWRNGFYKCHHDRTKKHTNSLWKFFCSADFAISLSSPFYFWTISCKTNIHKVTQTRLY
jgi:hypothetical protein